MLKMNVIFEFQHVHYLINEGTIKKNFYEPIGIFLFEKLFFFKE